MLCTAVKLGGRNLYTIEHLLSSMAGCGLSYIHIEVDGKEIPLLDGSAIQWVREFEEVGIGDILLELDGSFKCFLGLLIMILAIPWLG